METSSPAQANNPLHGITLKIVMTVLVDYYGWDALYQHIPVNCFNNNPSIQSSLKFLRKTPWARNKVELLYLNTPLTTAKDASP